MLFFILLIACNSDNNSPNSEPPTNKKDSIVTTVIQEEPKDTVATNTMDQDTIPVDTTPVPQKVEKPSRGPAKIQFETTTFKYDTLIQEEIVDYKFNFTNVGERPLIVKDVYGSCGCTIGSKPFLDIAPKESNFIKARFDSKGKKGYQKTTITVETNGNPKIQKLILEGFVKPKKESK